MKVLMVNKFLYPNGGSETYIFRIGEQLQGLGHEVQFFGMADERNIVGNNIGAYTSKLDFHGNIISKLLYPFKIIYSVEAKRAIRRVLVDFKPDVVHLNNINFQLTPSIIKEVKKNGIPVIWTVHDYQLVCPNHMMYNLLSKEVCEKCLSGKFSNCIRYKCIHGSKIKSLFGTLEAITYKYLNVYGLVDKVICPSYFLENKLISNSKFMGKTIVWHNFIESHFWSECKKKDYVLYFGRYSYEKGISTLLNVAKKLPHIQFVFAGKGPLENEVNQVENVKNVGFKTGSELENLIREARFSIYPSEWYENCPFSVMESQMFGTPVIGANIGGIPELIQVGKTGFLFESGDANSLLEGINLLWNDKNLQEQLHNNCRSLNFDTLDSYCKKLLLLYQGEVK